MKKVLIITYYWPPSGGAGVQRWLKFAKYLHHYDIKPIVLTVDSAYAQYPAIDYDLVKDEKDIAVYKTKTIEPFGLYKKLTGKKNVPFGSIAKESQSLTGKISTWIRANLFIPDARTLWKYYAIKKGKELIKKYDIDCIITTSPPNSVHQIGLALKKQANIPWIADLRDPWTNNKIAKFLPRTGIVKKIDKGIEENVFRHADKLLVVSKGMAQEYEQYKSKLAILTNGFDVEDFEDNTRGIAEKFTISYNGNLKATQNVASFWKALQELCGENSAFAEKLSLQFVGKITQDALNQIESHHLGPHLNLVGYVSHSTSLTYLKNAALLYLPIPNAKNNEGILTGKIFEYLATELPILSIGPVNGNANAVLKKAKQLEMADYNDTQLIKTNIINTFEKWAKKEKGTIETFYPEKSPFNRKALTANLAAIINETI